MALVGLMRLLRLAVGVGHVQVFNRQRAFMAAGLLAFALCAASRILADTGPLGIILDNTSNGGGYWESPFTDPNTTTGGALWIAKQSDGHNSSSTPGGPVMLDEDVNIQIAANLPGQGWVTIAQALESQGTTRGDITANDYGLPYGYGGYFSLEGGTFTSSNIYSSNPGPIELEIWAWTGNYNDPTSAASNNQYVLDPTSSNGNNIFNATVAWDSESGTWSAGFGSMPALTLTLGGTPWNPTNPTAHPGDANEDGRVDINDLTIVLSHFGDTGCTWTQGSMDGDPKGTVDINDLTIVLANYGWTATSNGPATVPEPSALVLLGAVVVGLVACVWRGAR
jgi:hypothetical protein